MVERYDAIRRPEVGRRPAPGRIDWVIALAAVVAVPVFALPLSAEHSISDNVTSGPEYSNPVSCASNGSASESTASNPFLSESPLPFKAPAFDQVKVEHYLPAFEAGMLQQLEQVRVIAENADSPTFDNTMTELERSGEILRRVSSTFFNMTSAHTNSDLQAIQAEIAPRLAAHSDNIKLNEKLFQRIQALYQNRATSGLNEEQLQLLKEQYEDFVRAGAQLTSEQKIRIRAINEELSSLTTKFQNNLLAITKERAVIVDDVKQLDGMEAAEIDAAAEAAKADGKDGKYLLQITNTTRQPILSSLNDRSLRQRVWEASAFRGLGRDGGIDNRPLLLQIARLRAERAAILGFSSHAAYQLQPQMAKEPAAARKMLQDLVPTLLEKTRQEADDIRALMKQEQADFELMPWDWEYYAEKVRRQRYDIDENVVRQYFELDQVLKNGVFFTMNRLYGIEFRERHDLPVYHEDVRVFDVIDADGTQLGLFYADYFRRDSKRGGAWMSSFVDQSGLLNERPVIINVMNIPRPAEGEPALISFDNVTTMFHEMGHALHGLFSAVHYPSVSGTSVPRDFVEFPSTAKEDWAIHPEVLRNYARHHETGEQIPVDLLDRIVQARHFNQGFDTLEYVSAALLDLEWHALTVAQIPQDAEVFETDALKRLGVDFAPVPPRYRSSFFAHIWAGGYSASYYAYMWSEVLAADAFAFMFENGGLTRENGNAFRGTVLSRGGSREPMKMYIDFRGQQPTVDALLIRRGLQ